VGKKQLIGGLLVSFIVLLVLLISLMFLLIPSEEVIAEEELEELPKIWDIPMGVTTEVGDFKVNIYAFDYTPFIGRGYEGTFVGVKPPDYFLIVYAEITNNGETQKPLQISVFSDKEHQYSEQGDLELNADLFYKNRLKPGVKYKARIPYEVEYGRQHEVRLDLGNSRYKRIRLIK